MLRLASGYFALPASGGRDVSTARATVETSQRSSTKIYFLGGNGVGVLPAALPGVHFRSMAARIDTTSAPDE